MDTRNTSKGRTAYPWKTKPHPTRLISSIATRSAEFSWLFKGKSSLKLQLPHMSFQIQHKHKYMEPSWFRCCARAERSGLRYKAKQCQQPAALHGASGAALSARCRCSATQRSSETKGSRGQGWKSEQTAVRDARAALEGWQKVGYNNEDF